MGSEWKSYRVDDFAEVIGGGTPRTKKEEYWNGEIPWITPKDLSNHKSRYISKGERNITQEGLDNSSAKMVPKGTVLLSSRAPVGYLAIAHNSLCTNQGFRSLILKEGFLPEFIYYLLKNNVEYLQSNASGTTFQELSGGVLKTLEFKIPDYNTQCKIAKILGAFDDKIELNQRMNRTLEEIARAVFKSWFVDFDPVRAKMAGEPYPLPDAVMALFPDRLVESELGLIPEGWEVVKVKDKIEILTGYAFKSKDYVDNGVFLLRTRNFTGNNIVIKQTDDVYLPIGFLKEYEKFICQRYDFHVVMVGASVGKTSIIYQNSLPALRNQNMWCIRPKNESPYRFFVNLSMEHLIESRLNWASGSARNFFRKGDFNNFHVLYPQQDILLTFEEMIKSAYKKIDCNLFTNDRLKAIRNFFVDTMFS